MVRSTSYGHRGEIKFIVASLEFALNVVSRKRAKFGQILGQVIVYILAAILFVMILSYGYRAITGFQEKAKHIALIEFKTDLETAVGSISRDYGSVRTINFILPEGFTGLCIVDSQDSGMLQADHPLLYNAWRGGAENIFLLPISMQSIPLKADNMEVWQDGVRGFLCIEDSRNVRLRFEGKGDGVKITVAPSLQPTARLVWTPAGLVVNSCPATCTVRQIVSTTLSNFPGCSEISSYGARKTFCCCPS